MGKHLGREKEVPCAVGILDADVVGIVLQEEHALLRKGVSAPSDKRSLEREDWRAGTGDFRDGEYNLLGQLLDQRHPAHHEKGLKIEIDGAPCIVTDFQFSKPGKGQAIYRCKIKNLATGSTFEKSYRSGDKVDKANLESRTFTFSYHNGDDFVFSDNKTAP